MVLRRNLSLFCLSSFPFFVYIYFYLYFFYLLFCYVWFRLPKLKGIHVIHMTCACLVGVSVCAYVFIIRHKHLSSIYSGLLYIVSIHQPLSSHRGKEDNTAQISLQTFSFETCFVWRGRRAHCIFKWVYKRVWMLFTLRRYNKKQAICLVIWFTMRTHFEPNFPFCFAY